MSTASNQKQMKGFYRQRKKSGSGITKTKTRSKSSPSSSADLAQPPALPSAASPHLQDDYDAEEEVLRQFDMNMAYGPCLGMSRLARWERASRLGLNPPKQIEHLLKSSNVVRSQCLWDSRI